MNIYFCEQWQESQKLAVEGYLFNLINPLIRAGKVTRHVT